MDLRKQRWFNQRHMWEGWSWQKTTKQETAGRYNHLCIVGKWPWFIGETRHSALWELQTWCIVGTISPVRIVGTTDTVYCGHYEHSALWESPAEPEIRGSWAEKTVRGLFNTIGFFLTPHLILFFSPFIICHQLKACIHLTHLSYFSIVCCITRTETLGGQGFGHF